MPPRSVFGQLAWVILLVLAGAALLGMLLVRELAVRPGAEQALRVLDQHGAALSALVAGAERDAAAARLRHLGFVVRTQAPPAAARPPRAGRPAARALLARAPEVLDPGRALVAGEVDGEPGLWLRLDAPGLWVAVPSTAGRRLPLGIPVLLMLGCALLVWLVAGWYAGRLVRSLRRLAMAAPGIARGETLAPLPADAPHELHRLADALAAASTDVRVAASERALMLAGISHDLRTPLTRMQFAIALMPDTDRGLSEGVQRDVAEMDAILAQFIAYARDGRDEASEPLDLAAVCRGATDAARGAWALELPPAAPLRGKPMALTRAVENLVVNAERHGRAPFALRLRPAGHGWRLEVADGGAGLDAETFARLLQPFARGEGGGSGLGLAIVERVARLHGGSLEAVREAGGFAMVLRLRDA
ncbi:ATP-binding protein [Coralloluteibacterium stylophorae]|uniref:histidine kinase n=3 Tax=Coralloluteibacterium stylophorae TaxID=1776034 RepID=A0AAP2C8X3_9GAMM|nr:ATP-binding protein [Coralloluteibacterium stylophorae]MBS7456473.1 hypothetical protein [Coralloluteibacterium stylophorae]